MSGELALSSITLDGAALDFAKVLADVTIRHGRADVNDPPQASTCQMTLLGVTRAFTRPFHTGSALVVNARINDEFVVNPGAEVDVSGWTPTGGATLVRDTIHTRAGSRGSFKWTNSGTGGMRNAAFAPYSAIVGTPYTLGVWIWAEGTAIGRLYNVLLRHALSTGFGADIASQNVTLVAGWNYVTLTGTPTDPTMIGFYYFFLPAVTAAGETVWLDDWTLKQTGLPRFTGLITDAELDIDTLTVVAVSRLSTLSQYLVGAGDWPAETWSARVTRIFSEAGLSSYLELQAAAWNPMLAARVSVDDGGAQTLDSVLSSLADMVGAAVVDRPNGKILVQAIGARSLANRYTLAPAEVEYPPAWTQELPLANKTSVVWTGGTETVSSASSIAIYGPRPETITTTFTSQPDAARRANERIARRAYPHWTLPAAPLLVGRNLAIGTPLQVSTLPAASPYDPWTPILEGWTDTVVSDGSGLDWTMTLALSDPLLSGLSLPWNAVPTTDKWNTIAPAVAWKDALTLADLEGT